jgi:hypothetical protein
MNDGELIFDTDTSQDNSDNGRVEVSNNGGGNTETVDANKEDVVDLSGQKEVAEIESASVETPLRGDDDKPLHDIEAGTVIEFDNNSYTVDTNGNLVDANGAIFKEAKDVDAFIKEYGSEESTTEEVGNFEAIRNAVGVDVLDEEGNPIQFDNTPEGIAAYVKAVNEHQFAAAQEAAINTIFEEIPSLEDYINYVRLNGSHVGFGEITDRSNITLDKDNISQQESIIRASFNEFNKRGDVEAYIKYLKDSGSLYDVAEEELNALKDKDKEEAELRAQEVAEREAAEIEELQEYWNDVKETIDSGIIGKYKIPENIIIKKDGKTVTRSREDFFNYLYKVDNKGISQYERDREQENPKDKLNDEILRALLKFTGGSYSNLVDMAVNEKEVKKIILQKRNTSAKTIRITKQKKTTNDDIVLE